MCLESCKQNNKSEANCKEKYNSIVYISYTYYNLAVKSTFYETIRVSDRYISAEKVLEELKRLSDCRKFPEEMKELLVREPEIAQRLQDILNQPDGIKKLKSLLKIDKQ